MAGRGEFATIQVTGLAEILRALRSAPGRLDRELGKANKNVVNKTIKPPVRRRAPKLSGRLARTVRGGASAKGATLMVGNNATIPYAGVINFGWPARGIKAQEFIYAGINEAEPSFMETYLEAVDKAAKVIAPQGKL